MGFNEFISKLFGNKASRDMKEIQPWVEKVKAVYPEISKLTNDELRAKTEELKKFGIPIACCSDGPSGIRMDCGTMAYALPNGTLLACTFDPELVEELYEMEGM